MKTLIAVLALTLSSTAFAHYNGHRNFGHHHHHHRHWHHNHGWVAPLIIGGAVGYALNRPAPVFLEMNRPAPIIVQQPLQTVVLQPNQVMIDGVVYTKQTMIINGVETEVLVKQ